MTRSIRATSILALAAASACSDPPGKLAELVPTTVHVSPGALDLDALFATARLEATVYDQNGDVMAGEYVSWRSSSFEVARVDQSGGVTAVDNGSAYIAASAGQASDSVPVTVWQRPHSVRIPPPDRRIIEAIEDTVRVTATVLDRNGRPIAGAEVSWSSGDNAVATVDEEGLVTSAATGTTLIRATLDDLADSVTVEVRQVPARVRIVPADTLLTFGTLGDTLQLAAYVVDSNDHPIPGLAVSWSTSDTTVAAISHDGMITATGNGTATVTATALSATGSTRVRVEQVPASMTLESPADLLPVGDSVMMEARAFDAGGSPIANAGFTWTSSDPAVAGTTPGGLIRAVAVGTAAISASLQHLSDSVTLTTMNRDEFALRALFRSTDGEGWAANGGWGTDAPLSEWHGVEVDASGRVRSLVLTENNLAGRIPPEIAKLDGLEELHLEINLLEGPLPPETGRLESLVWLGLSDNRLEGPLPPEIGMIEPLEIMDLSYNGFTGSIPREVIELPRLWFLSLFGNALEGPIPREIGNSPSLRVLDLCYNRLTGPIPAEIGRIETLERLKLCGKDSNPDTGNRLSGAIPPEIGNLSNLRILDLGANRLEGPIPPELGDLDNLDSLWLYSNLLTSIPPELGALTHLQYLSLYGNRLTGPIPKEIGDLRNLEKLLLGRGFHSGSNSLEGSIPPELGNLESVFKLDLGGNELTGGIPPELGRLGRLEFLELGSNELTGPIPPELGDATRLTWVAACPNNLSGPIPGEIGNLRVLRRLYLCSNDLTGTLPPSMGRLVRLRSLHLGDNLLTGALPSPLRNLRDLDEFIWHVRNTGLCAPDTDAFREWLAGIRFHSGIFCTEDSAGAGNAEVRPRDPTSCSVTRAAAARPVAGPGSRKELGAETLAVACGRAAG